MTTFVAHSDGKILVPDEPVELRAGTKYLVSLRPRPEEGEEEEAVRSLLHGRPKR